MREIVYTKIVNRDDINDPRHIDILQKALSLSEGCQILIDPYTKACYGEIIVTLQKF